jgi:hypothetical protein
MPITPSRRCRCHGAPMYVKGKTIECVIKRRLRSRRYQTGEQGHRAKALAMRHFNARRVWIGERYLFAADTPDEAARLKAHIKRRIGEFTVSQRAEAREGLSVAL